MQMNNLTITNAILNNAYLDYVDKCAEVDNFFKLIDFLENTKNISASGADKISSEGKQIAIDRSLIETIQSSSFLLLYNLIESTMTAAIDAIYQNLQHLEQQHQNTPNLFIFNLKKNLRKSLIKQYAGIFSIDGINDFSENKKSFFSSVINHGYDKKNLFNGNIDCSQIDDITRNKFGFKVFPFNGELYNSQHILSIKNKRNNLAHGSQTFTEVSQHLAVGELQKHFDSVIKLLNGVFSSIEHYLVNQKYLDAS
jgi:hypothetical protein